jgi:hypothetical protein
VVIIFGICFATVLTLGVVPVMYSLFEGLRYYIISAFRGPRWKEAPRGRIFLFSRRRFARIYLVLIALIQVAVLAVGLHVLTPGFIERIDAVTLQAPSLLKLVIEASVFFIGTALEGLIVMGFLLIPTWAGLIFLMAKRSREGYCVEVTPEGISVGTPVDRFFLEKAAITGIKTALFFPVIPSLRVYAGNRRIVLRRLVAAEDLPEHKSLWAWLGGSPPQRRDIRRGMLDLKASLEKLLS